MADLNPGDGNAQALHAYWTKGPGLALWAPTPHPWTALYTQLNRFMASGKAKRTTSAWFEDVFGYPPSARQGKNPVGRG